MCIFQMRTSLRLCNFLASGLMPPEMTYQQRKKFLHDEEPYLFKQCADQMIRRCVTESEDSYAYVKIYNRSQQVGNISRRNEMLLTNILEVELYILIAVDYVSKWVEVEAYLKNDAKMVMCFLQKYILTRFETPRVIINNEGSHFVNKWLKWLFDKCDMMCHPN
ncbi:Transposon Ty3-I Gag-Pol polyprotein [Gossypium australe]|uniref:Transposon Ty3-I Gag-Pol polyprotein n=1 Tax=Gossypium australe TaxID=47621 RepID=A0A5B6W6G0_9ROSI|nr:Transposon Ty3-I Gag-Pol polyprotein [Gossypium australe]